MNGNFEDKIWEKLGEIGEGVATTKVKVETLTDQNREQFNMLHDHDRRIAVAEERYVHESTCEARRAQLRKTGNGNCRSGSVLWPTTITGWVKVGVALGAIIAGAAGTMVWVST